MSRAEAEPGGAGQKGVRVYRSVEELPDVLEPGRYVIEGEELEILEPLSREAIAEILRFFREHRGHRFI